MSKQHWNVDSTRKTCSDINELPIVSLDNWCIDRKFLFSSMPDFGNWSLNENVCVIISCTNNVGGFVLIFCLEHFSRSSYFDCFLGKFNVITRNLDKLLTIEKRFILDFLTGFWIHLCRVICIQKYSHRGIPKARFSERFFKISRKVSLTDSFSKKL